MQLSPDAQAIIMICSRLSLTDIDELKPLTTGEWNTVARQVASVNLRPGDLLDRTAEEIRELIIDLDPDQANRIVRLTQRGAALAYMVRHLREREAQAFMLKYRDNCSIGEIAARMGVERRTVSRYLSEGLKRLQRTLAIE